VCSEVYCNIRKRANITNQVLFLSFEDYLPTPWSLIVFGIFADLGNVIAKELYQIYPYTNGYLTRANSYSSWIWKSNHYYTPLDSPTLELVRSLALKLWELVKSIIVFIIVSTTTTFAFRVGLFSSSIILIATSNLISKYS